MNWWIAFAVFLYFISALLLIAEVFVPSGGLISICSLACMIGGLMIFFRSNTTAGWIGIVVALVMIPSVLIIAYRIFPKTRFGKSVILTPPQRQAGDAVPDSQTLQGLIGTVGTVLTPLRPVGIGQFDGQRFECVAESGYVEKDKKIEVINVEGTQLTVRTVTKGPVEQT